VKAVARQGGPWKPGKNGVVSEIRLETAGPEARWKRGSQKGPRRSRPRVMETSSGSLAVEGAWLRSKVPLFVEGIGGGVFGSVSAAWGLSRFHAVGRVTKGIWTVAG
jgi:hypothetical protein